MNVIAEDLWLFEDCMIIAVNADYTGIESDARIYEIDAGLTSLGPNLVPDFDETEGGEEFSWRICDCCRSHLGGRRYRFAQLGE